MLFGTDIYHCLPYAILIRVAHNKVASADPLTSRLPDCVP